MINKTDAKRGGKGNRGNFKGHVCKLRLILDLYWIDTN